eukprot:g80568.t1
MFSIWRGLSVSSRVPPGYMASDAGDSLGFQETGRCVNPARTLTRVPGVGIGSGERCFDHPTCFLKALVLRLIQETGASTGERRFDLFWYYRKWLCSLAKRNISRK